MQITRAKTKRIAGGALATGAALLLTRGRLRRGMSIPSTRLTLLKNARKGGKIGRSLARTMSRSYPLSSGAQSTRIGFRRFKISKRKAKMNAVGSN